MVEVQSLSVSCGIWRVSRRRGKEGLPKGAQRPGCDLSGATQKMRRTVTRVERYHWRQGSILQP